MHFIIFYINDNDRCGLARGRESIYTHVFEQAVRIWSAEMDVLQKLDTITVLLLSTSRLIELYILSFLTIMTEFQRSLVRCEVAQCDGTADWTEHCWTPRLEPTRQGENKTTN